MTAAAAYGDFTSNLDLYDYADFIIEVGKGKVPGHSAVSINGVNDGLQIASGSRMIWRVDGDYNFLTAATTLFAVSSDNADTQVLAFTFLDADFNEVTDTVTLTGQTPVAISATAGIRLNACTVTGTSKIAGSVSIMSTTNVTAGVPNDTDDIVGFVPVETQRLNQSLFTVPAGKIGIVLRCLVSAGKNQDANFSTHIMHPTDFPDLTITELGIFQNTKQIDFVPFPLGEKSDAFIEASSSSNNTTVSLRCAFLIIDKEFVDI